MKTLFGSNYIDVVNNSIKYYVSFKNPTRTTPDMCETKENLLYDAERLPLEGNGQLFYTEAGRKAYIGSIKQGLAFDCATSKAIFIDKSTTITEVFKKLDEYRKKHPEWPSR